MPKSSNTRSSTHMQNVPVEEMHGSLAEPQWAPPRVAVRCDQMARPGYESKSASEFVDDEDTLLAKVRVLADLLKRSQQCCAYTGAGISTSAGINDYASKAAASLSKQQGGAGRGFDAKPTYSHRVLVALQKQGILKHWIQQNHDGLPQKAGFPQELLNEIHGSWYDPSNPVVPMAGTLRKDLCAWLNKWVDKADLTLALGTSLCGMNADRMVTNVARKAARGKALGVVIVALQQTQHDGGTALRIFARIDDVMTLLAREMGLTVRAQAYAPDIPRAVGVGVPDIEGTQDAADGAAAHVYTVPYTAKGSHTVSKKTVWDLSAGAKVKVVCGPGKNFVGTVVGRNGEGHVRLRLPYIREGSEKHGQGTSTYVLGSWWLEAAVKGSCKTLPVVNV